ncbi:hypothetical protein [Crenothrix sp.]|uniref:hypothetical protein n=1 Tax=Crenothrix sp. TaxID=3100433 RepID=UPI00374DA819
MKSLAAYIMQGRIQAMIAASCLALLSLKYPPVSVVSSASVALVTLRRGGYEGLYILGCAALAAGLMGFFILGNFQFAVAYVMVLWLPIWLISIVLREGRHLSLAVEIAVILGVIGVIAAHSFMVDPTATWKQILIQMAPATAPVDNTQRTIEILSRYMTGIIAAGSVIGLLLGLFLGRWWQAILYNPGGFRQEFLSLSTRPGFTLSTLLIIGMAFTNVGMISDMAKNISIVLVVHHIFIGAAILHTVFSGKSLSRYSVPVLYVVMILIPHTLLAVALIGLTDRLLNLRKNKFEPTDAK